MTLSQIRREIDREIAINGIDSPRVTELAAERDRLRALEPAPRIPSVEETMEDMARWMRD